MQRLQRIIKQTDFVFWFQRGFRKEGKLPRGSAPTSQAIRGHPGVSGTGFLICGLFPVVKAAWSPFNRGDDLAESYEVVERGALRLLDKRDKQLRTDIKKADELYDTGNTANYEQAYEILMKHLDKREPEVLWRIGRIIFERGKRAETKEGKQRLIEEAFDYVFKALAIDEENFAVHKWMAILLNELSVFKGIKEQILQSVKVKNHMLRAAELNPEDATSIYLLGSWCYTVADIPWYQRKVAETLFATPPSCTFQEAYRHFLRAEYTKPRFYSKNVLMLAKSCIKMGDMDKAEKYLLQLKEFKVKTEDDFMAKKEGKELRQKLFKAKNYGKVGESAEEEKS